MSSTFTYVFDKPSEEPQTSEDHDYSGIQWFLEFQVEDDNAEILLFGRPHARLFRPGMDWVITVDVTCEIGHIEVFTVKDKACYSQNDDLYGATLLKETMEKFQSRYRLVEEDGCPKFLHGFEKEVSVKIHFNNIRTRGLRKFPIRSFKNCTSEEDLTISIKRKKLMCHSLVLRLNSPVLGEMIKQSDTPHEITLDEKISVHEMRELLHHIYHPGEIIDIDNLRKLLYFGKKFQMSQLLERCQQWMQLQIDARELTDYGIIEFFLLSWKYDLVPLKMTSADKLFPKQDHRYTLFQYRRKRSELFSRALYRQIEPEVRLELLEFLSSRLEHVGIIPCGFYR